MTVVIDIHNHYFDLCPRCRNFVLIIRVPSEELNEVDIIRWRQKNNKAQIRELIDYCDANGVAVTRQERKAA